MKKQIVLNSPVVVAFDRGKTKPQTAPHGLRFRPMLKCRLDSPPNDEQHMPRSEKVFAKNPAGQPRRILVVEDEAGLRQIYVKTLVRHGYQVETKEDGEAGWNALRAGSRLASYDLLIADNEMPKLSGVELIQRLRSAQIKLPVILASGALPRNTDGLQLEAILSKPFSLDQLIQAVDEVLYVVRNEQKFAFGDSSG